MERWSVLEAEPKRNTKTQGQDSASDSDTHV